MYPRESGYYPPGAEFDKNAPWNQTEPDEMEFDMICRQTLSKSVNVFSTNYTEGVDEEYDDEGNKFKDYWVDTSQINWEEEYHANDYHTPLQLITLFKSYLEDALNGTRIANYHEWELKHLIDECNDWEEDDSEYVED